MKKTIGIVAVAAFGRKAAGVAEATITAARRRTSSAANSGNRSLRPCAHRYSIATILTFDITGFFQTFAERTQTLYVKLRRSLPRNPITGIVGCCARAASGHAPPRRRAA